jgi:hypothetical protein
MKLVKPVVSSLVFAALGLAGGGCTSTRLASAPRMAPADAERAACAEVPDADRDQGPFARRERIVSVSEVRDKVYPKAPPQLVGAAVYVRATPGVTEQWLGRVIECHLAHRAAAGDLASDRSSPFSENARVSVSSTSTMFRVAITSPDIDVARSVLAKSERLVAE